MFPLVGRITTDFSSAKEVCYASFISPPPLIFAGNDVLCIVHDARYSQIHDVALFLSSRVDQILLDQLKKRKGKQQLKLSSN